MTSVLVGLALAAGALLAAALAWGGPKPLPPLRGVAEPFSRVDFSDLPAGRYVSARDGAKLAYRLYPATTPAGSVVLIHGSSADSRSMHVLAKALAGRGFDTYTLDVRGHGASGQRGRIAHIGQMEQDLYDWLHTVDPARPCTLSGFSSGGGFVLRVAGSAQQALFQHYLLLAPFLGQNAPTYRPDCGWVSTGVPRLWALRLLNRCGIRAFNHLTVIRFALDPAEAHALTATYAFALAENFRPQADYRATIRAVRQPMAVLAGTADKVMVATQFEPVFQSAGKRQAVKLLDGITHVQLILQPDAVAAVADNVFALQNTGICREAGRENGQPVQYKPSRNPQQRAT